MTPTLSEALAPIVIAPAKVEPDAGEVMVTVGGVQSEPLLDTVTVTGLEVATLPEGALVSPAPRSESSTLNWTAATWASSGALAVTVMAPQTVDPDEGDVMVNVGGEVSLKTVTVTALEVMAFPAASRAWAVRAWEP